MFRSLLIRLAIVVCVCLICTAFLAQTFGTAAPASPPAAAGIGAGSPPPGAPAGEARGPSGLEWGVVGVLLAGVLVFLFWPRRRAMAREQTKKDEARAT